MMERKLYCGAGKEKITPPPELLVKLPGLLFLSFCWLIPSYFLGLCLDILVGT